MIYNDDNYNNINDNNNDNNNNNDSKNDRIYTWIIEPVCCVWLFPTRPSFSTLRLREGPATTNEQLLEIYNQDEGGAKHIRPLISKPQHDTIKKFQEA